MSASASANSPASAEAVFHAAAELPAKEREAFVAEQCRGDAAIQARVLRLLAAHEASANFMATIVSSESRSDSERVKPEEAGEHVGPYKLLQQIGEGGFGTVWMAEQDRPVRRQVALKIIKMGMDTREVVARFEQERQALAMMEHPHIAQVFDAGVTPFGRPFFVMELVRGVKITTYCDEHDLTMRARIELFIQVCQAVQHAHQKGIIHRDLKPSNVLVTINDGEPVVKVIDFGVAKATQGPLTDSTAFTQFEQMIGTPLYMSPEQAGMTSLDIDTRSDIYSLGVLLYELLTGRTPIDTATMARAGMDEIRRLIREVDPPRPSARVKTLLGDDLTRTAQRRHTDAGKLPGALRGDLDWIVMKCLEKDRKRRYDTANGLALDLQRHLSNEIVAARPPTNAYRLRKLIRRHRLAFAAGASVLAALLIGIAFTTWQAVRATRAEHEQTRLRKSAETEVARSKQVSLFLQTTLAAVDPNIAAGRDTTLLRLILDSAEKRVGAELSGQPDVEADLRTTIGDAYISIGEPEKGEQMHREALRLRRMVHGPEHLDVSLSLERLGFAYAHRGMHPEAEASMREALAMRRKLLPTPDEQTATILAQMVWPLQTNGHHADAVKMAREALEIRTRLFGEKDYLVAVSLGVLGSALRLSGDLPGAEVETSKSRDRIREVGKGDSVNMAQTLTSLGKIQLERDKAPEAETTLREAVAIMTALVGRESLRVADILTPLSQSLTAQGKLEEAEKLARETVAIRQAKQEPGHPNQYWALRELNQILQKRADYAGAEPVARKMVEWMSQRYGPDHAKVADALMSLAEVLRGAGKTDEAEQEIAKATAVRQSAGLAPPPPGGTKVLELWNAGERAGRKGDWVEAARAFTTAVAADPQVLGTHLNTFKITAALVEAGDIEGYRRFCESLSDAVAAVSHPTSAICLARAGLLLPETGLAIDECTRLADLAVEKGSGWPSAPWYLATQALSEYRGGRFENAIKAASKSLADPRCSLACRPLASPVLAMAHYRAGRTEEARTALQAAEEDLSKGWTDDTSKDLGISWHDWLIGHILLREARGLIEGPAPVRKPAANETPPPGSPAALELWNAGDRAGRKGDWVEAAKALSLSAAADIHILAGHNSMKVTTALVEAGDIEGYRKLCASLSDAVASANDIAPAICLARAGLLLPDPGIAPNECSRLADLAVAKGSASPGLPWYLATQALSEYRCGRFENAIKVASMSLTDPRCSVTCRPLAGPVLAMAHYRAGHLEAARAALEAAEKDLRKGWLSDTHKDLGDFWHDWLIGHILLCEARGLIEDTAPAVPVAVDSAAKK